MTAPSCPVCAVFPVARVNLCKQAAGSKARGWGEREAADRLQEGSVMAHVFVFGSNLAGRHGKGAASHAAKAFGAERGVGIGRTGSAYAVPTKDGRLNVMPVRFIKAHLEDLRAYADAHRADIFELTPVGCGLAGHDPKHIAKAVDGAGPWPHNVSLSRSWLDHLDRDELPDLALWPEAP